MRELDDDLWTYNPGGSVLRCVTTNCVIDQNNHLVMGAGVAKTAKDKYPDLPKMLGKLVSDGGNHVYVFHELGIASFPTKYHWRKPSELELIKRSAEELLKLSPSWDSVLIPRPGCGMGGLKWQNVRPVLSGILKFNRFIVMHKKLDWGTV